MILFFDTSALVKFFHQEKGTDVVVSLVADTGNEVWVSELVRLEFGYDGDVGAERAQFLKNKRGYT